MCRFLSFWSAFRANRIAGLPLRRGRPWKTCSVNVRPSTVSGLPAVSRLGTSTFPKLRTPFLTPLPGADRLYERTGLRRAASPCGPVAAVDGTPCRRSMLSPDRRLAVPARCLPERTAFPMTGNGIASGGIWGAGTDGHFIPGPLLDGLGMTVRIALFGLALAVAAGLGAALLRLSPWPVARGMAHVYVGCLRNTPLLLQLFFVYFLFAPAIGVGPFGAAVLALGLFEGAYMAELFRAGLQSVPRAQWEAGISLGLGVWNTLRLVILPQAVRRMLPPLTSQLVSLIKDTSLVSAIAVADLTMQAQVLIADTFLAFEIWLIVAALYLALTLCVALPARWMERRYAWR